MRQTTKIVILFLALTQAITSLQAQTQITSCNSEFMDIGGDTDNYLNNENSDWLICPDTLTEYLELEFTHVNIETANDEGEDSTGCRDILYIYDGVDDTYPLIGSFCGEESGSGKESFIAGHTLKVGDRFKPTNSSGCFYIKFHSNNNNRLSGWYAEVNCCVPTLIGSVTDGVDLPVSNNGGNFFTLEVDNSCVRPGKLSMFTEFEGQGSACFTSGLSQPNRSFYAFESNGNGGFIEILAAPVDSVGIIEMVVFGPVVFEDGTYTGGVINDCVTGKNPWPTFFNAGPNQTYILAIATELSGRASVDVLPHTIGLGGVLPVVVSDYSIQKRENQAILSWTTEQETNNDGFKIYRSTNGREYKDIGWVDGKSNSNRANIYTFADAPDHNGQVYYYVSQIDLDGTHSDLDILSVRFEDEKRLSVYPNPSNGFVKVDIDATNFDDQNQVIVYDQLGRIKLITKISASNSIEISELATGIYTIQIIYNGAVSSHQHVMRK